MAFMTGTPAAIARPHLSSSSCASYRTVCCRSMLQIATQWTKTSGICLFENIIHSLLAQCVPSLAMGRPQCYLSIDKRSGNQHGLLLAIKIYQPLLHLLKDHVSLCETGALYMMVRFVLGTFYLITTSCNVILSLCFSFH